MKIEELKNRLEEDFPNIYNTILINGDWGIGKTYFIKEEYFKYKKPVYISLFGIKSFEDFKIQLYLELNGILGFLNKKNKELEGTNLGILGFSLSIPYFEKDIVAKIEKRSNKEDITFIIDDIERKSDQINIELILGLIESISKIKRVNIILIANESEIPQKDKEKYNSFKEKVIQKTYLIDEFSNNAIENVLNSIKLNGVNNEIKYSIRKNLQSFFLTHKVTNLRTIERGIKYINFIFNKIDATQLTDTEIYDICITALAIVIEKLENKSSQLAHQKGNNNKEHSIEKMIEEKYGELPCLIIKKYFNEQIIVSIKYDIIIPLIEIYDDINICGNITKINKYYAYKRESAKNDNYVCVENMFYLSEENQKKVITDFYENSILKVNPNLDINSWFKTLNNIYMNGSLIGIENMIHDEKVICAMDLYLKELNIKDNLNYLLFEHIPFEIKNEKIKEYENILNKKIRFKYYEKYLKMVKEDVKQNKYNTENLEILLSVYTDEKFEDKKMIIDEIEKNGYFIPNLNFDILEISWRFAHKIWSEMRNLKKCRNNSFEIFVNKILDDKTTTVVGKFRINALNSQYNIKLDE